jgi:hypothetical protein
MDNVQKVNNCRFMSDLHSLLYANSFTINTEKTKAMSFHTRQKRDPIKTLSQI